MPPFFLPAPRQDDWYAQPRRFMNTTAGRARRLASAPSGTVLTGGKDRLSHYHDEPSSHSSLMQSMESTAKRSSKNTLCHSSPDLPPQTALAVGSGELGPTPFLHHHHHPSSSSSVPREAHPLSSRRQQHLALSMSTATVPPPLPQLHPQPRPKSPYLGQADHGTWTEERTSGRTMVHSTAAPSGCHSVPTPRSTMYRDTLLASEETGANGMCPSVSDRTHVSVPGVGASSSSSTMAPVDRPSPLSGGPGAVVSASAAASAGARPPQWQQTTPPWVAAIRRPIRDSSPKLEQWTGRFLRLIGPTSESELLRCRIFNYLRRLVLRTLKATSPAKGQTFAVLRYGSLPLMTYLPDGDIDAVLAVFQPDGTLEPEASAGRYLDIHDTRKKGVFFDTHRFVRTNPDCRVFVRLLKTLISPEVANHPRYPVTKPALIEAEVRVLKFCIRNVAVDLSVGGPCSFAMLDLFDRLIVQQNHVFKRSVLLIKAWCNYESRTLGSKNGLLATYALEVLVMCLMVMMDWWEHQKPLSALTLLRRFLMFYANFEWDHYAVTAAGPFPLARVPYDGNTSGSDACWRTSLPTSERSDPAGMRPNSGSSTSGCEDLPFPLPPVPSTVLCSSTLRSPLVSSQHRASACSFPVPPEQRPAASARLERPGGVSGDKLGNYVRLEYHHRLCEHVQRGGDAQDPGFERQALNMLTQRLGRASRFSYAVVDFVEDCRRLFGKCYGRGFSNQPFPGGGVASSPLWGNDTRACSTRRVNTSSLHSSYGMKPYNAEEKQQPLQSEQGGRASSTREFPPHASAELCVCGGRLVSEAVCQVYESVGCHWTLGFPKSPQFQKRNMNIVDPLQSFNNLGRSVSTANFYRIIDSFKRGSAILESIIGADDRYALETFFKNSLRRMKTADVRVSVMPLPVIWIPGIPSRYSLLSQQHHDGWLVKDWARPDTPPAASLAGLVQRARSKNVPEHSYVYPKVHRSLEEGIALMMAAVLAELRKRCSPQNQPVTETTRPTIPATLVSLTSAEKAKNDLSSSLTRVNNKTSVTLDVARQFLRSTSRDHRMSMLAALGQSCFPEKVARSKGHVRASTHGIQHFPRHLESRLRMLVKRPRSMSLPVILERKVLRHLQKREQRGERRPDVPDTRTPGVTTFPATAQPKDPRRPNMLAVTDPSRDQRTRPQRTFSKGSLKSLDPSCSIFESDELEVVGIMTLCAALHHAQTNESGASPGGKTLGPSTTLHPGFKMAKPGLTSEHSSTTVVPLRGPAECSSSLAPHHTAPQCRTPSDSEEASDRLCPYLLKHSAHPSRDAPASQTGESEKRKFGILSYVPGSDTAYKIGNASLTTSLRCPESGHQTQGDIKTLTSGRSHGPDYTRCRIVFHPLLNGGLDQIRRYINSRCARRSINVRLRRRNTCYAKHIGCLSQSDSTGSPKQGHRRQRSHQTCVASQPTEDFPPDKCPLDPTGTRDSLPQLRLAAKVQGVPVVVPSVVSTTETTTTEQQQQQQPEQPDVSHNNNNDDHHHHHRPSIQLRLSNVSNNEQETEHFDRWSLKTPQRNTTQTEGHGGLKASEDVPQLLHVPPLSSASTCPSPTFVDDHPPPLAPAPSVATRRGVVCVQTPHTPSMSLVAMMTPPSTLHADDDDDAVLLSHTTHDWTSDSIAGRPPHTPHQGNAHHAGDDRATHHASAQPEEAWNREVTQRMPWKSYHHQQPALSVESSEDGWKQGVSSRVLEETPEDQLQLADETEEAWPAATPATQCPQRHVANDADKAYATADKTGLPHDVTLGAGSDSTAATTSVDPTFQLTKPTLAAFPPDVEGCPKGSVVHYTTPPLNDHPFRHHHQRSFSDRLATEDDHKVQLNHHHQRRSSVCCQKPMRVVFGCDSRRRYHHHHHPPHNNNNQRRLPSHQPWEFRRLEDQEHSSSQFCRPAMITTPRSHSDHVSSSHDRFIPQRYPYTFRRARLLQPDDGDDDDDDDDNDDPLNQASSFPVRRRENSPYQHEDQRMPTTQHHPSQACFRRPCHLQSSSSGGTTAAAPFRRARRSRFRMATTVAAPAAAAAATAAAAAGAAASNQTYRRICG